MSISPADAPKSARAAVVTLTPPRVDSTVGPTVTSPVDEPNNHSLDVSSVDPSPSDTPSSPTSSIAVAEGHVLLDCDAVGVDRHRSGDSRVVEHDESTVKVVQERHLSRCERLVRRAVPVAIEVRDRVGLGVQHPDGRRRRVGLARGREFDLADIGRKRLPRQRYLTALAASEG